MWIEFCTRFAALTLYYFACISKRISWRSESSDTLPWLISSTTRKGQCVRSWSDTKYKIVDTDRSCYSSHKVNFFTELLIEPSLETSYYGNCQICWTSIFTHQNEEVTLVRAFSSSTAEVYKAKAAYVRPATSNTMSYNEPKVCCIHLTAILGYNINPGTTNNTFPIFKIAKM